MPVPAVIPAVAAPAIRIGMQAGATALFAEVAGGSALAASAGTVILATGGAAAIVLAGVGLYNWLAKA